MQDSKPPGTPQTFSIPKSLSLLPVSKWPFPEEIAWSWLCVFMRPGQGASIERYGSQNFLYFESKSELPNVIREMLFTVLLREYVLDELNSGQATDAYLSRSEFLDIKGLLEKSPNMLYFRAAGKDIVGAHLATNILKGMRNADILKICDEIEQRVKGLLPGILQAFDEQGEYIYSGKDNFSVNFIPDSVNFIPDSELLIINTSIPFVAEQHGIPEAISLPLELQMNLVLREAIHSEQVNNAINNALLSLGYDVTLPKEDSIGFMMRNSNLFKDVFPLKVELSNAVFESYPVKIREGIDAKIEIAIKPKVPIEFEVDVDEITDFAGVRKSAVRVPCDVVLKLSIGEILNSDQLDLLQRLSPQEIFDTLNKILKIITEYSFQYPNAV
jgi:hypothetical protein